MCTSQNLCLVVLIEVGNLKTIVFVSHSDTLTCLKVSIVNCLINYLNSERETVIKKVWSLSFFNIWTIFLIMLDNCLNYVVCVFKNLLIVCKNPDLITFIFLKVVFIRVDIFFTVLPIIQ